MTTWVGGVLSWAAVAFVLPTLLTTGCKPSRANVTVRDSAPAGWQPDGPTGTLEGTVTLTEPLPMPSPIALDAATRGRRGCEAAAGGYYASPFGVTAPGPLPEALVVVEARTQNPPPPRTLTVTFRDCSIAPRFAVMNLGDRLVLHAETDEYHLPKVEGLGATIAQLLQRTEDQVKNVQRPGRYIIHSVNYPNWMQTPLVVLVNPYYAQADPRGRFRVERVPVGTHTVHAWFPGARSVDATVTIRPGQVTRQDFAVTPSPPAPDAGTQAPTDAGPVIP